MSEQDDTGQAPPERKNTGEIKPPTGSLPTREESNEPPADGDNKEAEASAG